MGEYFELAHYHNLIRILTIHWDGPIALAAATAASSFTLAHYFFETALGCAHCICRYYCNMLNFSLLYFLDARLMTPHLPILAFYTAATFFSITHLFSE